MRSFVWPVLMGAAAATLVWWLWALAAHLATDHTRLHQIWELELQRAAAVRDAQTAQPAP